MVMKIVIVVNLLGSTELTSRAKNIKYIHPPQSIQHEELATDWSFLMTVARYYPPTEV